MKHELWGARAPATPEEKRLPRVVIVGGGFTGAAAATALLSTAARPLSILILEPANPIGAGLAYGRAGPSHLLNVPAEELSILPGRPGDFAEWAADLDPSERGGAAADDVGRSYLPRRVFAAYVRRRLQDAMADAPHMPVMSARDAAQEVLPAPGGYTVLLRNGGALEADAVILATGYGVRFRDHGFGQDPYAPLDRDRLARARHVVCVGTGLTMVDALVSLREAGFTGAVTAVSRRGLLPEPHAPGPLPEFPEPITFEPTARSIVRAARRAGRRAAELGLPWQSVVQALRTKAASTWMALDHVEQRRFLRHVSAHWSVRRHRLPPEAHAQIARELATGTLRVRRGRALGVTDDAALLQLADCGVERLEADLVLDCSGHAPDVPSTIDASLERCGLGRRDPHRRGLLVALDGGVIDAGGTRRRDLFALGPLGQGALLETTSAPEIVRQAAAAALTLASRLEERGAQPPHAADRPLRYARL